jgi:hypothetical protein
MRGGQFAEFHHRAKDAESSQLYISEAGAKNGLGRQRLPLQAGNLT